MFCISALRASSLFVFTLFLFKLFHTTVCESSGNLQPDNFINQEVSDFQAFLEEKLSNQGSPTDHRKVVPHLQQGENLSPFSNNDWDISSDESEEFSYEDVQEPVISRSNEEPQLTSAENVPEFNPLHKKEDSSAQRDPVHQNDGGVHEIQGRERRREETNHRPLEILLIRESDSKFKDSMADILEEVLSPKESIEPKKPYPVSGRSLPNSDFRDSMPDILEEALTPKKPIDKPIPPKEPYPVSRRSLSVSLNDASSPLRPDICSVSNHSFYDRQTCSSGYQYRLEPHLSATFSEDLKAQMQERYSPPKQTVCGFKRRMNPHKDVTERALCPFQWKVSEGNPSRIPEYLYEAKCSCTDSCTELKSKIRVLWRVGCEDQLHVYREGWEEIAVACVPTKPPIIKSEKAHRVKVTVPYN
ncbi:unnamed protein product [Larinioides sclopetarius]|uniref:Uncharacterized protein n=1 Tax=Larinioides sclopetarius TaxID=280406 RepID=A0AAV1YZ14_9ARAC